MEKPRGQDQSSLPLTTCPWGPPTLQDLSRVLGEYVHILSLIHPLWFLTHEHAVEGVYLAKKSRNPLPGPVKLGTTESPWWGWRWEKGAHVTLKSLFSGLFFFGHRGFRLVLSPSPCLPAIKLQLLRLCIFSVHLFAAYYCF